MSRAANTTRKPSPSPSPRAGNSADPPLAFSCNVRNRKSGTANVCLEEVLYLPYYHDISAWTPHVFVALYAMATFVHMVQAVISKRWFLLGTVVMSALCETIGWAGRWWSVSTTLWESARGGYWQSETAAYTMQAITLCIGPCFLNLGWYLLLTRLIRILGVEFCRFTPTLAGICLTTTTIVAMALQAIGAGFGASSTVAASSALGSYIVLAGLGLQTAIMLAYLEIFVELVWRTRKGRPAPPFPRSRAAPIQSRGSDRNLGKVKILLFASASSFVLILIRTCYRILILASGRLSSLSRNDALFSLLDGALVLLSLMVYSFMHPLWFLPPEPPDGNPEKVGDESWFDTTPFEDRTMQAPQLKPPATKLNLAGEPPRVAERQSGGSSFGDSENLEWVTENHRRTQMHPLYEGSIYSGK